MMKDPVTKEAFERAILATITSLYALAIDSADVMSVRIEYSSSMKMLNVIIFSATTTEHAHTLCCWTTSKHSKTCWPSRMT